MKHAQVVDTVSQILVQGKLGEEFRADFEKLVGTVRDAALTEVTTVVKSTPLTCSEIDAFRTFARSATKTLASSAVVASDTK